MSMSQDEEYLRSLAYPQDAWVLGGQQWYTALEAAEHLGVSDACKGVGQGHGIAAYCLGGFHQTAIGILPPTFRSLIWSTGEYRNHVPRLILSGFRAAEGIHGLIAEFLVWTARLRRFYGAERNMHWKYGNLSTLLLVWEGHQ